MEIAGAATGSGIVKASIASFPEELNALWRAMGWDLEDAVVLDGSHLVLVFFVDYELRITARVVPGNLTKFTDNEDHASYQAKFLKLATLRLYREQHQDLEGTWDPMEGRSKVASTMAEFCIRHGTRGTLHGSHHNGSHLLDTKDTGLYCTSRSTKRISRHEHWKFASRIRDVPTFALFMGAEFARQRDAGRYAPVTGLDRLLATACEISGLESVVHVHHGRVVYDYEAGDALFARVPEYARGLAEHFFKRTRLQDQEECRLVLSAPGGGGPSRTNSILKYHPICARFLTGRKNAPSDWDGYPVQSSTGPPVNALSPRCTCSSRR